MEDTILEAQGKKYLNNPNPKIEDVEIEFENTRTSKKFLKYLSRSVRSAKSMS